jgi:hypothetical protein
MDSMAPLAVWSATPVACSMIGTVPPEVVPGFRTGG